MFPRDDQPRMLQSIDRAFVDACLRDDDRNQQSVSRKQQALEHLVQIETARTSGLRSTANVFGRGYAGHGNGWTEAKPRILYPKERKRVRRHLRDIIFLKESQRAAAIQEETLVPVRLDIDYDKFKLRDAFIWNLNDNGIPIDIFAEHLCEDYGLPLSGFAKEIEKSLRGQVTDFHPHRYPEDRAIDTTLGFADLQNSYIDSKDDDLRIAIKLDITIGACNLVDQFEWDINNLNNNPERYAELFCIEYGLSTEFQTAISHAIREQCQMYTKSLFLAGYSFDSKGVHDPDLRQSIMPPVFSSLRPKHQMDQFAPILVDLAPEQLEKIERDREREGRRNRRQTRGKRGAVLPDLSDLPKTYRTIYTSTVLVPLEQQTLNQDLADLLNAGNEMDELSNDDDDFMSLDHDVNRSERSSRVSRTNRAQAPTSLSSRSTHAPVQPGALQSSPGNQTRAMVDHKTLSSTYATSRPVSTTGQHSVATIPIERESGLNVRSQQPVHEQETVSHGRSLFENSRDSPAPTRLVILKISKERLRSANSEWHLHPRARTPAEASHNLFGPDSSSNPWSH